MIGRSRLERGVAAGPARPEVGWDLLGLYYVQGRREDAHRLGLRSPRRRARPARSCATPLELLRQDAQPIAAIR